MRYPRLRRVCTFVHRINYGTFMAARAFREGPLGIGLWALGVCGALLAPAASARAVSKPLFKASASTPADPDTLEVYCLYVQFQDETKGGDDEATTTGLGTFGSTGQLKTDPESKNKYGLDPVGPWTADTSYLGRQLFRKGLQRPGDGDGEVLPAAGQQRQGDAHPARRPHEALQSFGAG